MKVLIIFFNILLAISFLAAAKAVNSDKDNASKFTPTKSPTVKLAKAKGTLLPTSNGAVSVITTPVPAPYVVATSSSPLYVVTTTSASEFPSSVPSDAPSDVPSDMPSSFPTCNGRTMATKSMHSGMMMSGKGVKGKKEKGAKKGKKLGMMGKGEKGEKSEKSDKDDEGDEACFDDDIEVKPVMDDAYDTSSVDSYLHSDSSKRTVLGVASGILLYLAAVIV